MEDNFVHSEKAELPIEVKVWGRSTDINPLQYKKAPISIETTPSGIFMELIVVIPVKAYFPMDVTPFGIIVALHPDIRVLVFVSIMALQLSLESKVTLALSTIIERRELQLEKALSPIKDVLEPILSEVILLQPEKALRPISVTLLGITTDFIPLQ